MPIPGVILHKLRPLTQAVHHDADRKTPGISVIPGIFCDYSIFVVSTFMPLTVSSPSTGITMQLRPSIFLTSGVPVSFVFTLTVTVGVFNSSVLVSERFS